MKEISEKSKRERNQQTNNRFDGEIFNQGDQDWKRYLLKQFIDM